MAINLWRSNVSEQQQAIQRMETRQSERERERAQSELGFGVRRSDRELKFHL